MTDEEYDRRGTSTKYVASAPPEWIRASGGDEVDCPVCHGTKMVDNVHNLTGDDPSHPCDVCRGEGMVPVGMGRYIVGLESDRDYWEGQYHDAMKEAESLRARAGAAERDRCEWEGLFHRGQDRAKEYTATIRRLEQRNAGLAGEAQNLRLQLERNAATPAPMVRRRRGQ